MFERAFNPCAGSATLSSASYSQSREELPSTELHAVRLSPESLGRRNRPWVSHRTSWWIAQRALRDPKFRG